MFTIQCGNCRAKLKVAKVELIGQSLACPRCGTMVTVQPPPDWVAPESPLSDEVNITHDPAKQPIAKRRRDQPAPATPTPEDLQETLPTVGSLGWGEELKLADVEPESGRSAASAIPAERSAKKGGRSAPTVESAPAAKLEKAVPDSLLRPEQWDSIQTRKRRTLLLCIMAVVAAMLVFGFLGYYWWENQSKLAALEKAAVSHPAGDGQDEANKVEEPKDKNSGSNKAADPDANPAPAQSVDDPNKSGKENENPSPPPNEIAAPADNDSEPADAPNPSSLDNPKANEQEPQPSESTQAMPGSENSGDAEADGNFQGIMERILESENVTSEWDDPRLREWQQGAADPIDKVLLELAQKEASRHRSARFVKPTPRKTDTQRSLVDKIAGFRHESAKVPQLMSVAETLSGLPVWLDVERYEGQPISLDEGRLVEAIQTTIPEFLTQQLQPFGFAVEQHAWIEEQPDVFGLRVFPAEAGKMRAQAYSVDWLAGDLPADSLQEKLNETAAFFTTYVSPGTWGELVPTAEASPDAQQATGVGGWQLHDGKIVVVHFPHVHKRIERVLRQFSVAKAQQGQPLNWPEELLPRAVQESGRLQTVINLEFYQPTPIQEIAKQIYKQSNVTIVFDWPSLIMEGWTPDTTIPVVVENQLVINVLQDLCLDMGISLRHLAPDVVCLMSDAAAERYSDVEVYPVADLCPKPRDWEVLRGRLLRLLAEDAQRYPSAYFHFEPEFGVLVARMPHSSHRKLNLYLRAARRP
ncbi:MAG: hypothetical protein JNL67_08280 [Planctomycetaceae bacterium]|nr:hypothetical protein [Planctomycetaceae bacterium]